MAYQLPLDLRLGKHAEFGSFHPAANVELCHRLSHLNVDDGFQSLFIWGVGGSGKTHLLQATCQHMAQFVESPIYLDAQELKQLSPAMFEGLEQLPLICVDDVHLLAGDAQWEEALFHLYNRCQQSGRILIWSAAQNPGLIDFTLADLASRLTGGSLRFHLAALDDDQRLQALQLQAQHRGLDLAENVARYLLTHFSRDMRHLCELLDQLDRASLAAQRAITIPFLKQWLQDHP